MVENGAGCKNYGFRPLNIIFFPTKNSPDIPPNKGGLRSSIPAGDGRWLFQIPQSEFDRNPNIKVQNER